MSLHWRTNCTRKLIVHRDRKATRLKSAEHPRKSLYNMVWIDYALCIQPRGSLRTQPASLSAQDDLVASGQQAKMCESAQT